MKKPIPRRRSKPRRGPANIPADEWRNQKYRDFLKAEGRCVVCSKKGCDPAHTEHDGTASKGRDASCAPLCRHHHDEYDGQRKMPDGTMGNGQHHAVFERYYRISMRFWSGAWWATFCEHERISK